jgi:hypothetical protein
MDIDKNAVLEAIVHLQNAREQIEDACAEAEQALHNCLGYNHVTVHRAEMYWLGHIASALGNDLTGSATSIAETIEELEELLNENEEN